jgi:AraC family transcriptional regulator of adaptative response/methylated-DNA-[protein]-cysteine methyltransferase
MERVEKDPSARLKAGELRALGIAPEKARRWFQQHHGMTFAAWCRARRLSAAFTAIREGAPLDDVILGHGFDSHSGFREAFTRSFAKPPGRSRREDCIVTTILNTPLGRMMAATTERGICFLEFNDRRMLEANYTTMRRRYRCAVVPGKHRHLAQLRDELARYFAGGLEKFTVPVDARGSAFQERVWNELLRIPHGETRDYQTVAKETGQPSAVRAVARANGSNRICILIPCHRVIAEPEHRF